MYRKHHKKDLISQAVSGPQIRKDIPSNICSPKDHYCVHTSQPLDPTPFRVLPYYSLRKILIITSNVQLFPTRCLFPSDIPTKNPAYTPFIHALPCPFHPSWNDHLEKRLSALKYNFMFAVKMQVNTNP